MSVLTSNQNDRKIFSCSANGGWCCDERIELHSNRWRDDADWDYWFNVTTHPKSLWQYLKLWWYDRGRCWLDISLTREDLMVLRERIGEELRKENKTKQPWLATKWWWTFLIVRSRFRWTSSLLRGSWPQTCPIGRLRGYCLIPSRRTHSWE